MRIVAPVGFIIFVLGVASVAYANFGSTDRSACGYSQGNSGPSPATNCVSLANNRTHAVRYVSLGDQWTGIDAATTWSLANHYNPTDLVAYVTTTDSVPDVWVYDAFYGNNGIFAWVDCPADNSGTGGSGQLQWCRGQKLRYNASLEGQYTSGLTARRALACHELGHTVGLRHNTHSGSAGDSCMRTTLPLPNHLSSHEINDHINPWY